MTKIAEPQPPYCASCFQHPAGQRCVDFEAAYDGPVVPGTPVPVPIDDLVLCEGCLEEAFDLIDPQNLHETIHELTSLVQNLQKEIEGKDKALQGYKFTTSELIDHPVAKFPGKPRLEGVPKEIREEITKNLYARRGTSPARKYEDKKAAANV